MDEREYVRQLAADAHKTVEMLSSHRKVERERRVVAAFLRCLGVDFSPEELVATECDPPDVMFRDARFEVMIVLDEGRRMHADWKKKAEQRDCAQSLEEVVESYHPSSPVPFQDIVSLVIAELGETASHYGPNTCSQLDALLYINLLGKYPHPLSKAYVPEELHAQGWRSVCFLFAPYSHVLAVTPKPPEFLHQHEGRTRQECQNPDIMFDL